MRRLIRSNAIRLNDQIVTDEAIEIDGWLHQLMIYDEPCQLIRHSYYMMNKPKGLISATEDKKLPTVCDQFSEKIWPIGRLDRNTEGLLLLTDNGQLSFRLPLPKYKVEKVYRVKVNGLLTANEVEQFARGIEFYGGIYCAPAKLEIIDANQNESEARVTITEGKFHQVKKMFLAVNLYVTYLQRIQYGPLKLGYDLQPGEFRALSIDEIKMLWDCAQLQY
ncbi:16S rRNA pseudouridine(516) synthase [Wohlfahrtiimonas larvae]|nr:16S rRNA pseudouridine(516) synthase [Wohlfahrtiimonas larvae]